nr:peptide chain release factor N(5)-glutamine methyltransferase [Cognatishimia sp. MH4019]
MIDEGAAQLRAAGIAGAERDARVLLAHSAGIASDMVYPPYSHPQLVAAVTGQSDWGAKFHEAITARAGGRPVSKIIGARAFWAHRFLVTDDVLDPRPETEILVEHALAEPFSRLLDLGTGSGCILLSLLAERPAAHGLGVDISAAALSVAAQNAERLGVADRVDLIRSDWFSDVAGQFDLIVSNPPYIAADEMAGLAPDVRLHDPEIALTPGGDGLDAYRMLTAQAGGHLAINGRLMVEIGPTQAQAVSELMRGAGLEKITVHPDLDGRDRVVSARKA